MNTQQPQFLPTQSQPMVMVKTEILSNQNNVGSFTNMSPVTTAAHIQQTNTFTNNSSIATTNGQQKIDNEAIDKSNKDIQNNESKSPVPPPPIVALDKQRLKELVELVDPNEQLEEEVEDVLLSLADDFIESLVSQACMLAKHRKSNHLDVKDVQLALDMNWNMWIPGFGVDGVVGVYSGGAGSGSSTNVGQQQQHSGSGSQQQFSDNNPSGSNAGMAMNRGPKKCLITEAHKQRLALIKKVMKKF
ncbi:Transcription initiation factor TFIID subunit 12-like protein [Euroglyphus maynei]|uniref:Transcription initiation factor TFIID subunit 12 n=1 Tax=Euroglyphus maynei TaxID=6958 RepID=A0A1Y3AT63_EURMA|nr:Transcription initiation factor TFIID subunit 12-like protein [Euroglyphus maynei]